MPAEFRIKVGGKVDIHPSRSRVTWSDELEYSFGQMKTVSLADVKMGAQSAMQTSVTAPWCMTGLLDNIERIEVV